MNLRAKKLEQIIVWATENEDVRVMMLTSSLVNPLAPVDDFSDLDIEFVFDELTTYLSDDKWISRFGKILSIVAENEEVFDGKHAMRMVLYDDYVKVDFKLYSKKEFLNEINSQTLQEDWDVGYKVLVDKDELTQNLKPPTYQSIIIKKPTEQKFNQVFNDFWWDMTYVAKCLVRDEIFYAKFMTENMMRTDYLVPIIEWYIGSQHHWNITTNKHGRLFKKYLSPELWMKIEATFSGSKIEENWQALFGFADLGHDLGIELAERLRYNYPIELENHIRKYLTDIKAKL